MIRGADVSNPGFAASRSAEGVRGEQAQASGPRQVDVAKRLGRYQSYVTLIETGQRRIDAVELVEQAEAIGFDPREAIKLIAKTKKK